MREYLAAGLPLVSSLIPEVEVLGLCRIANGFKETIGEINAALKEPGPNVERSEADRGESWESRIKGIREHLANLNSRAAV